MTGLKLNDIQACVFDAYGTLFDVHAAAEQARDVLGQRWQPLSETWRAKQLQYTWLRSLMNRYVDFWHVTRDALDYALASLNLDDPQLRDQLMALYLRLSAYPEVKKTLTSLKSRGLRLAILSNGTPKMLAAAAENAGISELLDAVLSVEEVGAYKPDPSVYQMAVSHLNLQAPQMCFLSSNAWDAHAAKAFGYRVIWCNRFRQTAERIPDTPDGEITTLSGLLDIL